MPNSKKKYFATAKPTDLQSENMIKNRELADKLHEQFLDLGGVNACTTIAIRKLQEAVMYANRAVLELD